MRGCMPSVSCGRRRRLDRSGSTVGCIGRRNRPDARTSSRQSSSKKARQSTCSPPVAKVSMTSCGSVTSCSGTFPTFSTNSRRKKQSPGGSGSEYPRARNAGPWVRSASHRYGILGLASKVRRGGAYTYNANKSCCPYLTSKYEPLISSSMRKRRPL
jgi:hypothetical protein